MAYLLITDWTGGEADEFPASIGENQVAIAQDVDFYRTTLANRRNGSVLSVSGLAYNVNSLIVHRPDEEETGTLWTLDENRAWHYYDTDFVSTSVTPDPADIFDPTAHAVGATLHGKLFIAARTLTLSGALPSGMLLNRLHVWDGEDLRRTGLAPPVLAPGTANAGSGAFKGVRYYRVRFVVQDADGTVVRRSEPSPEVTHTPTGSGASVTVSRPARVFEGETHWEVEESSDGTTGNWYRIATVAIGTTTYSDTINLPQLIAIADGAVLSADIGDYTLQGAYRFVIKDRDRLLGAGNFADPDRDNDVEWSVVGTDETGVSNDERVRFSTGYRLALDGRENGRITGFASYDGRVIGFKKNRVYSLTQTGNAKSAYIMQIASSTYGAMEGSVIEGTDESGRAALYFVDPELGPMRLGVKGFEVLAKHLSDKFASEINFDAAFTIVNAVYHPGRQQVWWHFAGLRRLARGCCPPAQILPDWPSFRWCYDVTTGGSSFHSVPRLVRDTKLWDAKPLITQEGGALVRCDVDEAPDDYGNTFRAYVRTRAWELRDMVGQVGIHSAMVTARSIQVSPGRRFNCATPSGVLLSYSLIRDYGLQTRTVQFLLDQEANEQYVIKRLDNANMGESTAIQVEIGDVSAVSQSPWSLHRTALRYVSHGENVS